MTSIRTLIIFGATGDLTSRLLLPGLGTLLSSAPELRIDVVGSSREPAEGWEQVVAEAFDSVGASGPAAAHTRETARYVAGDVTDAGDLERLLDDVEGPVCLYFALPPAVTAQACEVMAGLDLPEDLVLALEKPIGSDTQTARELNRLVGRLVPEERTFRVDHFLGMPAVLNFVGLRFANRLLEPLMSREHVESVEIVFDETLGLEGRAGFYEATGALRDMIQSHLLQVMALVMMEPPSSFDQVEIPTLTSHVLRATKLWQDDAAGAATRGRYTAGSVEGRELPDYAAEDGVDPERGTETFAQVVLEVDTWRWNGVPVTLRSGKAIGNPRQEIAITFRRPPHDYEQLPRSGDVAPDVLRMGLEEEQLTLELNVGGPFDSRGMNRVTLSSGMAQPGLTAYGSVLRGVLEGDHTFGVRGDAAEQGWRIVDEVLAAFEDGRVPLLEYPAGSSGPV
ncbi:glucose-6-phosphate dehydrogenase [Kocuria rosea]|uniref:Glucose-6-phosphate dehydrogenase n=1 Tax=Kocuria rosea TaxID=1275 RepID=A0A4R5YMB8_KOCRO|nr:glucose-6-phosphate dehydrogenase [Kocuria rosea]TDL44444.1 glucose-6-phosphate dehydrogenase [Kocuria rosea]